MPQAYLTVVGNVVNNTRGEHVSYEYAGSFKNAYHSRGFDKLSRLVR